MDKKTVRKYLVITVASCIYSVGVSRFTDPNHLAPGGVTGISIILSRFTPVSTGTWIALLNIPILLYGMRRFGLRFTVSTMYAIALVSFFTNIFSSYGAATDDILLSALSGGVLSALSIGMIFRVGATTGGMDIIIKALRLRMPHLKTGVLFFVADAVIVVLSGILFRDLEAAMYAEISAVCSSLVMDLVLYGRDEARLVYIISGRPEHITKRILEELKLGVTHIHGRGAYLGKDTEVILCAVKKTGSPAVEEIVRQEDAEAFMIVTKATEIFGEGYKSYFGERM